MFIAIQQYHQVAGKLQGRLMATACGDTIGIKSVDEVCHWVTEGTQQLLLFLGRQLLGGQRLRYGCHLCGQAPGSFVVGEG